MMSSVLATIFATCSLIAVTGNTEPAACPESLNELDASSLLQLDKSSGVGKVAPPASDVSEKFHPDVDLAAAATVPGLDTSLAINKLSNNAASTLARSVGASLSTIMNDGELLNDKIASFQHNILDAMARANDTYFVINASIEGMGDALEREVNSSVKQILPMLNNFVRSVYASSDSVANLLQDQQPALQSISNAFDTILTHAHDVEYDMVFAMEIVTQVVNGTWHTDPTLGQFPMGPKLAMFKINNVHRHVTNTSIKCHQLVQSIDHAFGNMLDTAMENLHANAADATHLHSIFAAYRRNVQSMGLRLASQMDHFTNQWHAAVRTSISTNPAYFSQAPLLEDAYTTGLKKKGPQKKAKIPLFGLAAILEGDSSRANALLAVAVSVIAAYLKDF